MSLIKEAKEPLVQAASKAKMTLEEFVRALVWTKERYRAITIRLEPDLVEKYESKFGRINSITEIENTLKDMLQRELA